MSSDVDATQSFFARNTSFGLPYEIRFRGNCKCLVKGQFTHR